MSITCLIIEGMTLIAILYLIWKITRLGDCSVSSKLGATEPSKSKVKKNQIRNLISFIDKTVKEKRYNVAKQCFNREPASFDLLCLLWELHKETLSDPLPSIIQRDMVQDMTAAIVHYKQTCDIEDIEKPNSISEELEQHSLEVLEKLRKESRDLVKRQLVRIQEYVVMLRKDPENKDVLRELEKLDNSLNKDLIEQTPELQAKYHQISEKLMSIFTQQEEDKEDLEKKEKNYNLKAIMNHKKALEMFEADTGFFEENNYKKGNGLCDLVKLIGGWDNRHLLPSTISYTNTIYGTIFSKLKKGAQLSITKKMVLEEKKPL